VAEHVQQAEANDFEKTMVMRPGMTKPAALEEQASDTSGKSLAETSVNRALSQPSAPAAALGVIQLLNGANAGRELELTKTLTTLGKPGVQVAVIAKRPQGYFITHVEGAQFPVINGQTIDAQAKQLKDHDVIEIAGIKMEFFLKS
ncbi:MAG: hypothetical protein WCL27_18570, partial [Betaproteobacteria bacterium]